MGEEGEQEEIKAAYFFDSYAIIELENGNPNYQKYSSYPITITIFNLAEIYWNFVSKLEETEANKLYEDYRKAIVEIPDETLKKAIKFRKENKKKNLSYTDCIGYIYALENKMRFLTGDREFKDMKNVEFVK